MGNPTPATRHPATSHSSKRAAAAAPPTRRPAPEQAERTDASVPFAVLTDTQVAQAEEALANVLKVKQLALRVTNERDWTDVNGRPYLNESGCMKVAALFGVSLTGATVRQLRETIDGEEVFRYVAKTTAKLLGREVEVEGLASSDEQFFCKRNGKRIPLSEVDLNAVRKKALSNAQNRAVKKILGLGTITWDEVRGAGVRKEKVATVEYKKPAPTAGRNGDDEEYPSLTRVRLANLLDDIAIFKSVPVEELLRKFTEFRGRDGETRSAQSIDEMSDAWVSRTLQRVEAEWRREESIADAACRKEVRR